MKSKHLIIFAIFLIGICVPLAFRAKSTGVEGTSSNSFSTFLEKQESSSSQRRSSTRRSRTKQNQSGQISAARVIIEQLNFAFSELLEEDPESHEFKMIVNRMRTDLLPRYFSLGGQSSGLMDFGSTYIVSGLPDRYVLSDIVIGLSKTEGKSVTKWLELHREADYFKIDRNHSKDWGELFQVSVTSWIQEDSQAAIRVVESNMDSLDGKDVRLIVAGWNKEEYLSTAQWVKFQMKLDNTKITSRTVNDVAGSWSSHDPAGAIDWLESFPEKNMRRNSGYQGIVLQWPEEELRDAVTWFAARSDQGVVYDYARQTLVSRLTKFNPLAALNLAMDITKQDRREAAAIKVARKLYKSDPESISNWLPQSGLSVEAQNLIILSGK